ncbi:hypothetical protein AB0L40_13090 [Patulibacter sp. NPDC049589]|uniref:hypothetical protein n=1 Tax=Patulibacter sp. NPDC049589 TaxID=3154731 RepID=UPI003430E0A1
MSATKRRIVLAAFAAAATATTGISVAVDSDASTPSKAAAPETWAPRGELGENPALIADARATWDAQKGGHHDVRVLYAGRDDTVGTLVVLSGRAAENVTRVAFLSGPLSHGAPVTGTALELRADVPDPTGPGPLAAIDTAHRDGADGSAIAIALAPRGGAVSG